MSPNVHQRSVSASFKLPPDLEKNITDDIAAGRYRSRSDAYVSVMREYYRRRNEDKSEQRFLVIEREISELKACISDLKARIAELEAR